MATPASSIDELVEKINTQSLNISRAVAITGSSHMTIRRAIRSGKLPSICVLGAYRIWPEDLRTWWTTR